MKEVQATGKASIPQKGTSSTSEQVFQNFFLFCVTDLLIWIRIRIIRILPTKTKADPCGSKVTTLEKAPMMRPQGKKIITPAPDPKVKL